MATQQAQFHPSRHPSVNASTHTFSAKLNTHELGTAACFERRSSQPYFTHNTAVGLLVGCCRGLQRGNSEKQDPISNMKCIHFQSNRFTIIKKTRRKFHTKIRIRNIQELNGVKLKITNADTSRTFPIPNINPDINNNKKKSLRREILSLWPLHLRRTQHIPSPRKVSPPSRVLSGNQQEPSRMDSVRERYFRVNSVVGKLALLGGTSPDLLGATPIFAEIPSDRQFILRVSLNLQTNRENNT